MPITQETRTEIFEILSKACQACCPPMVFNQDKDKLSLSIIGDKPVPYGYDKKIIPGMYFAWVESKKDSMAFYYFPLYGYPHLESHIPGLKKKLKGKTCFHFKKPQEIILEELQNLLSHGVEIWREAGYMNPNMHQQLPELYLDAHGNKTLLLKELDETYHSRHGAINESMHVFIAEGLDFWLSQNNNAIPLIFEVGFGSGLNAILSYRDLQQQNRKAVYHSIETMPLPLALVKQLDYHAAIEAEYNEVYDKMHTATWNQENVLSDFFTLQKIHGSLLEYTPTKAIDIVFFDAFAPDKQPELWTLSIFEQLFKHMNKGAVLVTYSAKGEVRRNLMQAGFEVEKRPGPPYKRHMLRAIKP